ncbi:hypothetical protein PPGU19_002560 [Paraburkholderia sp. PGU19]|nr:hypothetical protein PPGU19_002560 [Paraburkholderia sp. PGU19]
MGKPAGYAREATALDASGSAMASLRSLLFLVAIAHAKWAKKYFYARKSCFQREKSLGAFIC